MALTDGAAVWLRGAALVRASRFDEAAEMLAKDNTYLGAFYRALAEHGRGRPLDARLVLERVTRSLDAPSKDDPQQSNFARLPPDQQLEVTLLRREAEAKIGPPGMPRVR
jgi:hypothetical protein